MARWQTEDAHVKLTRHVDMHERQTLDIQFQMSGHSMEGRVEVEGYETSFCSFFDVKLIYENSLLTT